MFHEWKTSFPAKRIRKFFLKIIGQNLFFLLYWALFISRKEHLISRLEISTYPKFVWFAVFLWPIIWRNKIFVRSSQLSVTFASNFAGMASRLVKDHDSGDVKDDENVDSIRTVSTTVASLWTSHQMHRRLLQKHLLVTFTLIFIILSIKTISSAEAIYFYRVN